MISFSSVLDNVLVFSFAVVALGQVGRSDEATQLGILANLYIYPGNNTIYFAVYTKLLSLTVDGLPRRDFHRNDTYALAIPATTRRIEVTVHGEYGAFGLLAEIECGERVQCDAAHTGKSTGWKCAPVYDDGTLGRFSKARSVARQARNYTGISEDSWWIWDVYSIPSDVGDESSVVCAYDFTFNR